MTTLAKYLFARSEVRGTWMDGWDLSQLLSAYASGALNPFFHQTWPQGPDEKIGSDFPAIVEGIYKRNGIVAACMFVRLSIFAQLRFALRQWEDGRPKLIHDDPVLGIVENPWTKGTTGQLNMRGINDADLAGNAFIARRSNPSGGRRLKRMRPDWSTIVLGVDAPPEDVADPEVDVWEDLDADLVGYGYHPGGYNATADPIPLLPGDVAHFAPLPDPEASYRGMSWLRPLVREIEADNQATTHKAAFFRNSASPNLVVSLEMNDPVKFEKFIKLFNEQHQGAANAHRTLFFGGGANVEKVGHSFREMDYKATMAIGETRIASAAGLSAVIARISEGLEGSALNAGNYTAARRMDADTTFRYLWMSWCQAIQPFLELPTGQELWYAERNIPFLQEDEQDAAEIIKTQAEAISSLVSTGGFKPDSTVDAVTTGDLTRLEHSGTVPVQQKSSQGED